jgi:hypothetical protein
MKHRPNATSLSSGIRYFMTDQLSSDEALNSVMMRLLGRYTTLIRNEEKSENPTQEKIQRCNTRRKQISKELWTIFNQTVDFKDEALKKYATELKNLE